MPSDPPKRPRLPSSPEIQGAAVDKLVGRATDMVGATTRKQTFTGLGAMKPPALPGELAPTLPVPRNPLQHETTQRPAPPSAVALARRTDPPVSAETAPTSIRVPADETRATGRPGASLPPPSKSPEAATIEALRRRAEEAEAAKAKAERELRVHREAQQPGPYQPPLRSQSPVPSSAPSKTDAAIGKAVRTTATRLAERYGLMPLLLVFGMGGGAVAIAKPTADPAKADAVLASQQAMRADVALLTEQVAGMLKREAARDQYTACLEEVLDDVGEQVLPAQDRLGSAAPLRAYIKQRCRRLRP